MVRGSYLDNRRIAAVAKGEKLLALEAEDVGNDIIGVRPGKKKIGHTTFVPGAKKLL